MTETTTETVEIAPAMAEFARWMQRRADQQTKNAESATAEAVKRLGKGDLLRAADFVADAAKATAQAEVYAGAAGLALRGLDAKGIAEWVAGRLTNGAEDGWSGRSNDLKRTIFDGVREAAQYVLQEAFNLV